MREAIRKTKRFLCRITICPLFGCRSNGLLLWWMCNRCYGDFASKANTPQYTEIGKLTRSSGLLRRTTRPL